MITRLVFRFLCDRPWQFALAVTLCALGLASAISIVWLQSLLETHARRQAQGIDIVVGAQGSALQNVLAAVYYLDVPNGNIRLAEVDALRAHPMVAKAIPIALGDSVAGARIVGTTPEFVAFYGATLASGELPAVPMDAAIGAAVAARTGLKVGDNFVGAHGLGDLGVDHESHPYRVSGVLNPTGRVIDQTVVTLLESVWLVHEGHAASAEKEATFALLQLKSPIAMATLPRLINQKAGLQAAVPAMESARLLISFDWVALIVKAFAGVLIVAAMASLLGALLQALARQEPELAVLRAMGASRAQLAALMLGESMVLVAVSSVVAGALTAVGVWALQRFALAGLLIDVEQGFLFWLAGLLVATLMAIVATIPVLWRIASVDVAAQLSSR
ncbi:MAG: FtsX-like permease family protein [Rhizobacter sp.]|nr:FtsX-like permease family protein [Burkholderiales bacterium]